MELKLARAFLSVGPTDQQAGTADKLCAQATQLCLQRWLALPSTVSYAHVPLLHAFQQIVELQEAASVNTALQAAATGKLGGDVATVFDTWRHRLPNVWDEMGLWHDVMCWRLAVFERAAGGAVVKPKKEGAQTTPPAPPAPGSNETAFSVNLLAHVARLHKLKGVCLRSLTAVARMPNVQTDELFAKTKEQVRKRGVMGRAVA